MDLSVNEATSAGDALASTASVDDKDPNADDLNPPSDNDGEDNRKSFIAMLMRKVWAVYWAYDFPLNILFAICIALAYPKFGAITVNPMISAGWIATAIIFFVSGLGLNTSDLFKVMFHRLYFNVFVEIFNFGVVSSVVYGVSRALALSGALSQVLADGLAITGCLPMSINAVIILTQAANGDEAAAIFHTAFSNMTGIFLSPVLIVLYLPSITVDVDLIKIFKELTLKVIVPLIGGQLFRLAFKPLRKFYSNHKKAFMKLQEYCLIFIIYTVFCRKFYSDAAKIAFGSVLIVILFVFLCMAFCKALAWYLLKLLFRDEPKLRVMGLFGCVQKNIALGIPLIVAIFENSSNVSMYTLPILIWAPMQLVAGSALVPRLQKVIASETERIGDSSQCATATLSENPVDLSADGKV